MNNEFNVVRVKSDVEWAVVEGTNGYWVGICEPLKLTVQADTYANLMEDIGLTMSAVLKDLIETDELHQFLQSHGWSLQGPYQGPYEKVDHFDIPFHTTRQSSYDSARQLHL